MTDQEQKAMQMALHGLLDAREVMIVVINDQNAYQDEIKALRQALAQPEQEPVGWFAKSWQGVYVELMPEAEDAIPFYTAPPKREWVGLHLDDMPESYAGDKSFLNIAKWAEAKLKEKNGG